MGSASAELLQPQEARALAQLTSSELSYPAIRELVPSSAPFEPALAPQAPLVPAPSGSVHLNLDEPWRTPAQVASYGQPSPSLTSDERGWEQAREAFLAAGVGRAPQHPSYDRLASNPASVRPRAPSHPSTFNLQDLHSKLPTFAHQLPPRVDSPPTSFAFDPWASTSASARETPTLGRQPSSGSIFQFPTSQLGPHRPQTYPPARPIQSPPQDHRRTAPLPLSHDPWTLGQQDRQTDFPFVASPPPYPDQYRRPSLSASLSSWRAHSPNPSHSDAGYPPPASDGGRYAGNQDRLARGPARSDGAYFSRAINSADPSGRFAATVPPRQRQQSFESGLSTRPGPSNAFRPSPYYTAHAAFTAPLADRQPFPSSPVPSPSSSSPRPPAAAPPPKLRSGLPERSTWAMWVGNVPADATESELWVFFNQRAPLPNVESPSDSMTGVESIHLIARSNCAFINFTSNEHLHHAIGESNGIPLRPNERRCKPLVCRVRMREDDAKSGVGAQRGGGLHKAYIKALGAAEKDSVGSLPSLKRSPSQASSEGSTTSDLFAEHFPKRYFVLKAHSVYDIEESIRTGLWSTQGHNEAVLDQAYRTSDDVYLIFSANKSGAWAGYARMAGPIDSVGKSTKSPSPADSSPVDGSPTTWQLPSGLPMRASSDSPHAASLSPVESTSTGSSTATLQRPSPARTESGGTPFLVDWIRTEPIPFIKTRSILNTFNSGREVKISRDGTEVEPMAGEQLLQEFWTEPAPSPSPLSSTFNQSSLVADGLPSSSHFTRRFS